MLVDTISLHSLCTYIMCLYFQIQQLAQEIRELSLSGPVTIFKENSASSGINISSEALVISFVCFIN